MLGITHHEAAYFTITVPNKCIVVHAEKLQSCCTKQIIMQNYALFYHLIHADLLFHAKVYSDIAENERHFSTKKKPTLLYGTKHPTIFYCHHLHKDPSKSESCCTKQHNASSHTTCRGDFSTQERKQTTCTKQNVKAEKCFLPPS